MSDEGAIRFLSKCETEKSKNDSTFGDSSDEGELSNGELNTVHIDGVFAVSTKSRRFDRSNGIHNFFFGGEYDVRDKS